jgi:hypothetical protein
MINPCDPRRTSLPLLLLLALFPTSGANADKDRRSYVSPYGYEIEFPTTFHVTRLDDGESVTARSSNGAVTYTVDVTVVDARVLASASPRRIVEGLVAAAADGVSGHVTNTVMTVVGDVAAGMKVATAPMAVFSVASDGSSSEGRAMLIDNRAIILLVTTRNGVAAPVPIDVFKSHFKLRPRQSTK